MNDSTDVAGSTASVIVIGCALGEMLVPLVAGTTIEQLGPKSFVWVIFMTAVISSALYAVLDRIGTSQLTQQFKLSTSKSLRSPEIGYSGMIATMLSD